MKKIATGILALVVPSVAFAQTAVISDVNSLTTKLVGLGNIAIYILISLAVLYIVFNTVQYFIKGSSEEGARTKAGMNILWGIVGLAVILSIWGLVSILTNTFKTSPSTANIPNLTATPAQGGIPVPGVPQVQ